MTKTDTTAAFHAPLTVNVAGYPVTLTVVEHFERLPGLQVLDSKGHPHGAGARVRHFLTEIGARLPAHRVTVTVDGGPNLSEHQARHVAFHHALPFAVGGALAAMVAE